MTGTSTLGFALGAIVAALAGAAALTAWSAGGDALGAHWAARGFLAMALPAIAGGAWLAREHGRPGSRFLAALVAGIVVRLTVALIVTLAASRAGGSATTGLLSGLGAGFAPVMLFETAWFTRSIRAYRTGAETRG